MIEPRLLKGFRDFGPERQVARQAMFSKIQSVFEQFGFLPMTTPVLEYKDILMGKYGEDEKLVYSFKDNGDRDVAMRYDLTVPLARFVAQNQGQLIFPFKRYQIAPVWRADNTQKGRFREFYQCDIDAVGTASPLSDAEVIACLCKALEAIGLSDYLVRLNDRRNFEIFGANAETVIRAIDKFDKVGLEKVLEDLQQQSIGEEQIELAKQIMEGSLEPSQKELLATLQAQIIALGISESNIKIDQTIARGLDYYTSTVFEIIIPSKPEYGSVCGGGRYDNLVDQFSNQSLPAVGGSIGIDRLFDALESSGEIGKTSTVKALVLNLDESLQDSYVQTVTQLRQAGINAEVYYETSKLEKQFKYAESKGVPFAIIIGPDEANRNVVKLKNLATREQKEMPLENVASSIQIRQYE